MPRESQRILDEYLVCAARTGDRAAFKRLVERWHPRLWAHAGRVLGRVEGALDIVQDAWVDIVRGLGRLDDAAAFPAWAYRIVTRRCQRALPAIVRERSQVEESVLASLDTPASDVGADSDIDSQQLLAAVRQLPAAQRAAMALFYLEDMSVAAIAVALDVPPGTVKTRLMHARRKLRRLLEGAGNG